MEKSIIIDGDLRGKDYLSTYYSITSPDSSSLITVVERFYSRNEDDMYSYIERYKGEYGVTELSCETKLSADLTGNIVPTDGVLKFEFFRNSDIEEAKRNHTEAISSVSTTSRINLIPKYFSDKENIRFSVQRTKRNGETLDLTFAYPTDPDFRQQLRNIFNSVIAVNKLESSIIEIACMDNDIMPEDIGVFDATRYVSGYNKKYVTRTSSKDKQAIKK